MSPGNSVTTIWTYDGLALENLKQQQVRESCTLEQKRSVIEEWDLI